MVFATIEKMKITENTRIDPRVEYIVRDELKAKDARLYRYKLLILFISCYLLSCQEKTTIKSIA